MGRLADRRSSPRRTAITRRRAAWPRRGVTVVQEEPVTHRLLACRLNGDDYRNRIRWIEDLTRCALRDYRRDDLTLHLTYSLEAYADVRLMIEQERTCCEFLSFTVQEKPDAIIVTVIAPKEARGTADMLFAPFIVGRSSPDS